MFPVEWVLTINYSIMVIVGLSEEQAALRGPAARIVGQRVGDEMGMAVQIMGLRRRISLQMGQPRRLCSGYEMTCGICAHGSKAGFGCHRG